MYQHPSDKRKVVIEYYYRHFVMNKSDIFLICTNNYPDMIGVSINDLRRIKDKYHGKFKINSPGFRYTKPEVERKREEIKRMDQLGVPVSMKLRESIQFADDFPYVDDQITLDEVFFILDRKKFFPVPHEWIVQWPMSRKDIWYYVPNDITGGNNMPHGRNKGNSQIHHHHTHIHNNVHVQTTVNNRVYGNRKKPHPIDLGVLADTIVRGIMKRIFSSGVINFGGGRRNGMPKRPPIEDAEIIDDACRSGARDVTPRERETVKALVLSKVSKALKRIGRK